MYFCLVIYFYSEKEPQVIDYQTQQYKLFPLLATTYAFMLVSSGIDRIYGQISQEIESGNLEALPQVFPTTCTCIPKLQKSDRR